MLTYRLNWRVVEETVKWSNYFRYEKGKLFWLVQLSSRGVLGSEAGHKSKSTGYIRLVVNKQEQLAHRVIYEMHHGVIPEGKMVDHINGIRNDNRIENLRLATHQQNQWNRKKSEVKGWVLVEGKYQARIKVNSKVITLGNFSTPEEAHECYWKKKQVHHSIPVNN